MIVWKQVQETHTYHAIIPSQENTFKFSIPFDITLSAIFTFRLPVIRDTHQPKCIPRVENQLQSHHWWFICLKFHTRKYQCSITLTPLTSSPNQMFDVKNTSNHATIGNITHSEVTFVTAILVSFPGPVSAFMAFLPKYFTHSHMMI